MIKWLLVHCACVLSSDLKGWMDAHPVKCLPSKHVDMTLIPQTHIKKLVWSLAPNAPDFRLSFLVLSPSLFPHTCGPSCCRGHPPPVHLQYLFCFPFLESFMHLPLSTPCHLASLGLWNLTWWSFILQLICIYKWVHIGFILVGLGYITQWYFSSSLVFLWDS